MPRRPALDLQIFGVPVTRVDGHERPLRLKRAIALLAYLGHHPGLAPRAQLAALLWPDADEAQGRTRLRRLVYAIEDALGTKVLASGHDGLALADGAVEIDALRFARYARRAVAAQAFDDALLAEARGWIAQARRPLLQDIAFGSEVFDDWRQALAIEHEHLLARLLERLADALGLRGEFDAALELAEALVALDPYREPSHVLLMELQGRRGHSAGVEAAYTRCAEWLRAEFGIRPGPRTESAYLRITEELRRLQTRRAERPSIAYAGDASAAVAYTVLGSGARTLVFAAGFVGHIEIAMEHPPLRDFVEALSEHCRVILFDRRGVGLSERLRATSTPDAMAADIGAVLAHAGVERAWLFGASEGGLGAMRYAIDHPERVEGLCLFGALARGSAAPDYPWALPAAAYDAWLQRLVAGWGGPLGIETFAPSGKDDPALRAWWARLVRHGASPGGLKAVLGGLRDADLRAELHRIGVPTLVMHRRGDRAVRFEAGEHLARHIPGAQWHPLDGIDHFWWCGDSAAVRDAMLRFIVKPST